jgi:DNA-binding protein H-NS
LAKSASLSDLIAKKAALEKQIATFQREQRGEAIAKVKALMAEYGLTAADLGGSRAAAPQAASGAAPAKKGKRSSAAAGKKVAPKYRNPATGDTWTGRGLQPKWLKAALASGRALSDFAL